MQLVGAVGGQFLVAFRGSVRPARLESCVKLPALGSCAHKSGFYVSLKRRLLQAAITLQTWSILGECFFF